MALKHFSALLALGTLGRAWRANFSEAVQCGTVSVTWSATTSESIGPPFVVRVAAFGLAPLIFNLPTDAWSDSARAGSYSFTVPWPDGTRFLSVMDDGFGLGTGGISGIQTVKSSSNSTCIDSSITQPSHIFDVNGSFAQCSVVNMNWTQPATSQTRIAGLVPSGVAFQLDPPLTGSRSTTWNLNIEAGTAFVLTYNDGSGNAITSPLLRSLSSSVTECLASGAYPSTTASQTGVEQATATGTATTAITSIISPSSTSDSESSNSNSSTNLGPILGAVFGALALLGVVGVGVWLALRRRRRKQVIPQISEFAKEVYLDGRDAQASYQPGRDNTGASSHHSGGASITPFVLPYNGSHQQENTAPNSSRKRPTHETSGGVFDASDSSQTYTAGTSTSHSNSGPRSDVDDEPMIIRHEDAGAIIPPRTREVIELPPGYHELPRRLPPTPAPQQGMPQTTPSQKSTVNSRLQ